MVETARGRAEIEVSEPDTARVSLLVLGHGAGGDIHAPDLVAVRDAALVAGVAVALVRQPYRVAGRRAPAPAGHLDEAWTTVVAALRAELGQQPGDGPLIVGGRSSGARVACRTATDVAADGVLALVFPLHPPGRPERSRADELPTDRPVLVIAGERDPFGIPQAAGAVEVVVRPGERHDLRRDPAAVGTAAVEWLARHGWARA